MNVLHVFNEIKYSGGELMYASAAPIFTKNDIKLFALNTSDNLGDFSPEFVKANISVHHYPMPRFLQILEVFKYANSLLNFIVLNKIEIIHIHRSNVKWFFSLIAWMSKTKCIYTVHNVFKNRILTWPKAYLERKIAVKLFGLKIQTIGQSVYENELQYYKTQSIKINNWYDKDRFFPRESTSEMQNMRRQLNIPITNFVIVSTGGCSDIKNHSDILRALSILGKVKRNITYIHLGKGSTECEEIKLSKQLNLENQILFLGNRVNVRDYIIAADVYVMPSRFEGLGIAAIEAMACGIPVVLYNVPGLKDLIANDDNGFLISPDHISLSVCLENLALHPNIGVQKAINAREFVSREFDMSTSVAKIIALYKN